MEAPAVRTDNSLPGKSADGMTEQVVPLSGCPIYNLFFTEHEILREGQTKDL